MWNYVLGSDLSPQDAMVLIWRALIDDTRKTVDAHFGSIIKELLSEMGGRLWRNRQAAAAGLADLLQGRRQVESRVFNRVILEARVLHCCHAWLVLSPHC